MIIPIKDDELHCMSEADAVLVIEVVLTQPEEDRRECLWAIMDELDANPNVQFRYSGGHRTVAHLPTTSSDGPCRFASED